MKRNFRLTRTRDFIRVKDEGATSHHKLAVLVYTPNSMENSRVAIVASKAVGNAVTRNLIKRRINACVVNLWSNVKTGWDLIFYARTACYSASYNEIQKAISLLISKAGLNIDKN